MYASTGNVPGLYTTTSHPGGLVELTTLHRILDAPYSSPPVSSLTVAEASVSETITNAAVSSNTLCNSITLTPSRGRL